MQELLLVNPRRRRRRKASARKSRKHRSAAQRAATRKLVALMRARRGGSRKRRASASPKRHRRRARRARRSLISTIGVNPMRHRRHRRRGSARRRHNPIGRTPLSFGSAVRRPMQFLKPALIGAVGAVTVNTVMARLVPMLLPASMQATFMTGRMRYLTQGVAAIAVGMAAQKLGVRAGIAEKMAEGSLTVTLTDAIRDFAAQAGLPLGGMGYYLPGRRAGAVPSASGNPGVTLNGMGTYITGPGSIPGNVTPLRRTAMAGVGFGPGRTF